MARRTLPRALTSAVLLALLVTAIHPQPAFADEGTPPPSPPEAPSEAIDPAPADPTVEGAESPTLPGPDEGIPAVAEIPAPEAPAEAEAPLADVAAAPDATAEAAPTGLNSDPVAPLEAVPDDTTIAVVDAAGTPVPLVSEQAETITATADPVWCPASVKAPTPDKAGCSPSFGNLQLLLGWLSVDDNEPSQDGIIWIQEGPDTSVGPLDMQGLQIGDTGFLGMSQYKLTLRGGWDGVSGSNHVSPENPSMFTTRLQINNWFADVTLTDIRFHSSTGAEGIQITMRSGSPGNINLTRVHSSSHAAGGARLDTSLGTGKVSVTDSEFMGNTGVGLQIDSVGAVTLNHILVNTSTGNGAHVDTTYGTGSVTIGGASIFTQNGIAGLMVESNGAITAADLIASFNGNIGAALLNDRGTAAAGSPGITLTGSNEFTDNGLGGLALGSFGTITASNLHANGNAVYDGISIVNNSAITPRPVSLTGTSTAKNNGQDGIHISSDGKVTLNNLTANGNARNGLGVNAPEVALTGLNTFNENSASGVDAETDGAFTAANVTADRNGSYGLFLVNWIARPVTLSGINTFRDNYDDGLHLEVWGAVTLSNVTASGSTHGDGAEILNTASATAQKAALTGTNIFDGNYSNGLLVTSLGAISVSNLRASGNGTSGAGGGASLTNSGAGTPQSVTLTGSSVTSGNRNVGLSIQTKGNITAANVTAGGNASGNGAYLKNDTGTGNITLTGTNLFNGNFGRGLEIWSAGAVKISNLSASRNTHNQGALIVNASAGPTSPPRDVILSGVHAFDGNYAGGLEVRSYGAITLGSATAIGNGTGGSGGGISLDNDIGHVWVKPITMSGTFVLSGNHGRGLDVDTMGAVKINNLTASGNTLAGAEIDLTDATGPAAITLSGASVFSGNGQIGLDVRGRGPITLNSVTASGNGTSGPGQGLYVENLGASTPQPIKLTGTNSFCDNHNAGLEIWAYGAISAANVTASDNGGSGAYLVNTVGTPDGSSPGITLTGVSTFDGNDLYGLRAETFGAVSLNSVSGRYNGEAGLSVNNASAAAPKAVKLTGTNAFLGNGVVIESLGAISANNLSVVNAPGDTGYGTRLNNLAGTAGVTLTGANVFSGSTGSGLGIFSHGAVSLTKVTADDNAQHGIVISGPASSITITCGYATGNAGNGMQAATSGLLKLIGWFSLGVYGDDLTYGTLSVSRNCPLN
jgi:hypothetical protein